jgi:predicted dehydrogenase
MFPPVFGARPKRNLECGQDFGNEIPMNRRTFLQTASWTAASLATFPMIASAAPKAGRKAREVAPVVTSPNERVRVGCIGNGSKGRGDANAAKAYGDIVAVCDVDRKHAEALNASTAGGKAVIYEDYRRLLERKEIEVVTISTPDHWHTKMCIDAMRAGKDVYCQKPLTLTIEEGKQLCQAVKETGRILQVGTQQRSEYRNMFQTAVALVREGRIGKIKRAVCCIGGAKGGGPFPVAEPPAGLNWDLWLGQAPKVAYRKERCHSNFRWWYEYSGGKMTDWGAHHVDIAQWAIGMENSGPVSIEVQACEHPVPLKHGQPTLDDRFNTATSYVIRCLFTSGVEILIKSRHEDDVMDGPNGIVFEGEAGKFFVSRQALQGEAVDALKQKPISESVFTQLRKGKPENTHMGNFMACVKDRSMPISDVFSHHRVLSTCHLANIAMRLGRNLKWDPKNEQIVGDAEANGFVSRPQRKGYETA